MVPLPILAAEPMMQPSIKFTRTGRNILAISSAAIGEIALASRNKRSLRPVVPTASRYSVLDVNRLVAGNDVFFAATGITDGYLLEGVQYWSDGATTYSMVMRSRSGTIRYVKSDHRFEKLERFSSIDYRP